MKFMNTISLYVLFPDSDDDFVSLGDDIFIYHEILKQFMKLKESFPKRTLYRLFYSSSNIKNFCLKAGTICGGTYLDKLESKMRYLVGNNSYNTDTYPYYKSEYSYYRWCLTEPNKNVFENSVLIKSAAQKNTEEEPTAIVSFNTNEWDRDVLPIIIDATHIKGFPAMSNIPYFYPYGSFIEWYRSLINNRNFSLLDVSRFERTNYIYPHTKRRIYKHIETGDYWYYDFFHKDNIEHFEVYDATGRHKGEADINGDIDETKKDSNKSIDYIIHGH